jgi:O-antigen/teichoic acid export membrane protein
LTFKAATNLRSDIAWTAASKVAFMGAKLGVVVTIARTLGPYGQGVYSLFVATATIAASVFVLGQNISGNYFASRAGREAMGTLVANTIGIGVAGGITAMLTAGVVFHFVYAPPELRLLPVATLVGLGACLQAIQLALAGVLLGQGQFQVRAQLQIVQQLALFLTVMLLGSRHGVVGTIAAWAGAELLFALGTLVAVLRRSDPPYRLDGPTLRRQVLHGLGSQSYNVAQNVNARVDILTVGALFSPTVAGYYTVATTAAEAVMVIPKAMGDIVLSRIALLRDWHAMGRALALTAGGAAAIALTMLTAGYWLLPLVFGTPYAASWPFLAILTPGIVMGATAIVGTFGLFGLSRPGPAVTNTIAAAVTATVLAIPLALLLGPGGAAIASTSSYGLHLLLVRRSLRAGYAATTSPP